MTKEYLTDFGRDCQTSLKKYPKLLKYLNDDNTGLCIPEDDMTEDVIKDVVSLLGDDTLSKYNSNWCLERGENYFEDTNGGYSQKGCFFVRDVESYC